VALWRNGSRLRVQRRADGDNRDLERLYLINEAVLVAFFGFAVCALFLSLQMSEIFYCLCMLVNAVLFVTARLPAAAVPDASAGSGPLSGDNRPRVRLRRAPPAGAARDSQNSIQTKTFEPHRNSFP
jgi:hypothetical protein